MENWKGLLISAMVGAIVGLSVELYRSQENLTQTRHELKELTAEVDSLQAIIWPLEVELDRFNQAYIIFSERNPKAAEEYGTIISEETE